MSERDEQIASLIPKGEAMATKFASRVGWRVTRDEMISSASVAIIQSVDRYDGEGELSAYAHPRIHGQMIQDLRDCIGRGITKGTPPLITLSTIARNEAIRDSSEAEIREEVDAVISALPDHHQHPARTILLGGLSSHQYAKNTGTPIGIAKRAAREARRLLRLRLGHA